MFTWICPKCGSEVPPSYDECPNCTKTAETAPAQRPVEPAPPPPAVQQPAAARPGVPGWLVAILVAGVLVGAGAGAYFYLLPSSKTPVKPAADPAFETPISAPVPQAKPHPFAKYIELAGMRVTEDAKQKAQIRFLVINHSGAELGDVGLHVTLTTTAAKPGDKPLASFQTKVTLRPYESKEVEASVKTDLRAYELPDWQFLRAQFEITSPPAP